MLSPINFAPAIVLTLFTLLLLFFRAWRIIVKQERPAMTISDILVFGFLIILCQQLLVLGMFHSSPQTIKLCDHYEIVNATKVCMPINRFTLSAPFLKNTEVVDTLTAKIYDESGKEVGEVSSLQPLKDGKLVVTLTDDVQQKLVKYLKNDKHIFYLDIFIKGKLWRIIPFKLKK